MYHEASSIHAMHVNATCPALSHNYLGAGLVWFDFFFQSHPPNNTHTLSAVLPTYRI